MEFIYSDSVPIRKVDNTPLTEDEFYKVLNLSYTAVQVAREATKKVESRNALLEKVAEAAEARAEELEGYSVKWFDRVTLLEKRIALLEKVAEAAKRMRHTLPASDINVELLHRFDQECAALDAGKEGK